MMVSGNVRCVVPVTLAILSLVASGVFPQSGEHPEAARRIEKRRREALAELRLTLAAEKGACRAAGLPFDRECEDEYWQDYRDRIARAEAAVESAPARTVRGIEARCRHAARLIDDLEGGCADGGLARHLRAVILRIATDVAEIAAT